MRVFHSLLKLKLKMENYFRLATQQPAMKNNKINYEVILIAK